MPELQKLEAAFIKADDIANSSEGTDQSRALARDDAKAFANEIRRMRAYPGQQTGQPKTQDPGFISNLVSGLGTSVKQTGRGLGQLTGLIDQESIDQAAKDESELLDTWGGTLGNIGGHVGMAFGPGALLKGASLVPKVASALPRFAKWAGGMLAPTGAAANVGLGAAYSGIQPVQSGESREAQTAIGGASGLAGPVISRVLRGAKAAIDPFTVKGRNLIAGNVLRKAAGENSDDVAKRLISSELNKELVPGSAATAAEIADSGGISALQRSLSSAMPEEFSERAVSQKIARLNAVNAIGGTQDDMAKAVLLRKQAVAPLYRDVSKSSAVVDTGKPVRLIDRMIADNPSNKQLVTALQSARAGIVGDSQKVLPTPKVLQSDLAKRSAKAEADAVKAEADAAKRRIAYDLAKEKPEIVGQGKKALTPPKAHQTVSAKRSAKAEIVDKVEKVLTSPKDLKSASANIANIMEKRSGGQQVNKVILKELRLVKKSLDAQIGKAEPAFKEAQKTFQKLSKPINQMQVGQELAQKLEPALSAGSGVRETGSVFANALRRGDQLAAKATGFKKAKLDKILSKEDLKTVQKVHEDLTRSAQAQSRGGVSGSDTFQKLSMGHLYGEGGLSGWPITDMMPGAGVPLKIGHALGSLLTSGKDEQIKRILSQALLNPKLGGGMMLNKAKAGPLIDKANQRMLAPLLRGLAGQQAAQ